MLQGENQRITLHLKLKNVDSYSDTESKLPCECTCNVERKPEVSLSLSRPSSVSLCGICKENRNSPSHQVTSTIERNHHLVPSIKSRNQIVQEFMKVHDDKTEKTCPDLLSPADLTQCKSVYYTGYSIHSVKHLSPGRDIEEPIPRFTLDSDISTIEEEGKSIFFTPSDKLNTHVTPKLEMKASGQPILPSERIQSDKSMPNNSGYENHSVCHQDVMRVDFTTTTSWYPDDDVPQIAKRQVTVPDIESASVGHSSTCNLLLEALPPLTYTDRLTWGDGASKLRIKMERQDSLPESSIERSSIKKFKSAGASYFSPMTSKPLNQHDRLPLKSLEDLDSKYMDPCVRYTPLKKRNSPHFSKVSPLMGNNQNMEIRRNGVSSQEVSYYLFGSPKPLCQHQVPPPDDCAPSNSSNMMLPHLSRRSNHEDEQNFKTKLQDPYGIRDLTRTHKLDVLEKSRDERWFIKQLRPRPSFTSCLADQYFPDPGTFESNFDETNEALTCFDLFDSQRN